MLRPYPEGRPTGPREARPDEKLRRVSKDGRVHPCCHPSRRAQERAAQDEDNTSLQGGLGACAKWRIPEWRRLKFIVMPVLVAGIHVLLHRQGKTWMAGTKLGHD